MTRTIRAISSELPLARRHGLRAASVANCDTLQTIPTALLGPRPIGRLTPLELVELDGALRYGLGIRVKGDKCQLADGSGRPRRGGASGG